MVPVFGATLNEREGAGEGEEEQNGIVFMFIRNCGKLALRALT